MALHRCGPALANGACLAAGTCLIELRGDNKQFKLSLLTDDGFDSLNYQATFAPKGTDWQISHLPLADFRASFRGREVTDAAPLADATSPCIRTTGQRARGTLAIVGSVGT